jgi:hypothetical protein
MTSSPNRHPFLDMFASALLPHIGGHAGDHAKDPPPVEHLLPPGFSAPGLRELVDHFIAADHDVREDRYPAAASNLDMAEAHLRKALAAGAAAKPSYESALRDIAVAREAVGRKDSAHACGAIGNAVRALATARKG